MDAVKIKRIYDEPSADDGYRVLVDRLWPRGIRKDAAKLDEWVREIAPSTELRKWFNHKPDRFDEFEARYRQELQSKQELLTGLKQHAQKQPLCLLYAAKDSKFNQAAVLLKVLEEGL